MVIISRMVRAMHRIHLLDSMGGNIMNTKPCHAMREGDDASCQLMQGHQGMHVSHLHSSAWWGMKKDDNQANRELQGAREDDYYND